MADAVCGVYQRHWFSLFGEQGLIRPTCARCGAFNPKWAKRAVRRVPRRVMSGDELTGWLVGQIGPTAAARFEVVLVAALLRAGWTQHTSDDFRSTAYWPPEGARDE